MDLLRGDDNAYRDVNFFWELTDLTNEDMTVELKFDIAPAISMGEEDDVLLVTIYGNLLFLDYKSQTVEAGYQMQYTIPRQIDSS